MTEKAKVNQVRTSENRVMSNSTKQEVNTRDKVLEWIILNQFGRRNLSAYERSILALRLKPIYEEKAKANQSTHKIQGYLNSDKAEHTDKNLSKLAGVGHDTMARVQKIESKATPEVKKDIKSGKVSINQAYTEIARQEKAVKKESEVALLKEMAIGVKDNNFINGDSIEELQKIKDGSIDCLITDPPYGIDYISNYRVIDSNVDKKIENDGSKTSIKLWDKVCEILEKKMSDNSHMYIFTSWKVYPEFKAITEKYFKIKNCIIWKKNNWSMGDLDGNYAEQYEMIIFATKGSRKLIGSRDTNILEFDRVPSSKLLHSCEKPVKLIEYILSKSTVENELIADPFAGSGAILKACKNTNRNYWGCEISKTNYDIALGRLQ